MAAGGDNTSMTGSVRRARPQPSVTIALDSADFACAYGVATAPDDARSAQQWARAAWEDGPAPLRWLMLAGWRLILRFQLGPRRSPDHVLGWQIVEDRPDKTECHSRSPFLDAANVFQLVGDRLVWSTLVVYEGRIARVIWPPVALIHRLLVRVALGRAARRPTAG